MTSLFQLPNAPPPTDLWKEHRLSGMTADQVDETNIGLFHDNMTQRRMPSAINPDRDAPMSVPSSPQSTCHRASSTAHTSRSPPRLQRPEGCNPLQSFTSASIHGSEHGTPLQPPMLLVDPWQDEAVEGYPESVQSGDYGGEKTSIAIRDIKNAMAPQTQMSSGRSSGSTSNSIIKAALEAQKALARENTATWLSRQDVKVTSSSMEGQYVAPLTTASGYGHRAAVSDSDVSTIVEMKRSKTNRRSVRVSRGVPRGVSASGHDQCSGGTGLDTLALHGLHMPWAMQCTNDDDDDDDGGYAHQASNRGPVSARASSDISMSHIMQTDDLGDVDETALLNRAGNGALRTTHDDRLDVIEAEGHPLSFVVLHDGHEGQFWVTEHYLNQLTIADLTRLCLRATASVAATSNALSTPTQDDVQLHVVLSRQTSAKLGLSMQGAGMNLVPVEAWTFSTFPTMQFLLLKAFFGDVANREGFVRLLCTGRNQSLPSELTASRHFWHGWNVPGTTSLNRRQKATQTERAKAHLATRGVQTARLALGAEDAAPSSTSFLRSIRGLSELSSMVNSVERALDTAQESVNATFAERSATGNDKPLPMRPSSAPVEHRRTKNLTRPEGGLSSRFSEESGRESLDEEPLAILARWKRWNGQRNSGSYPSLSIGAMTRNNTIASRRPSGGGDDGMEAKDSDMTSVHSQVSTTSSIARKISIQRRKLTHMATHTVVRFRNQRPAHKRSGSRASVGKRRRAHTIDSVGVSLMPFKSTAIASATQGVVKSTDTKGLAEKSSGRFNVTLTKAAKPMRRKAPPPAPLDLSRLPQTRDAPRAQQSSAGEGKDEGSRAEHAMVGEPSDTDATTPSTASAVLSRELCARLLHQRAQDDELEAAARDVLRSVEASPGVISPMEMLSRRDRQSNAVEELDEDGQAGRGGPTQHDESDAHSISSSASFAGSTFAGIRRLFQGSSNSSVTSLTLVTPPASPAGAFKMTIASTSKQVSSVVKSGLTPFRRNRLGSRLQKTQTSQIGPPVLLNEAALPMSVTSVAAEMEPVIITHSPEHAESHHASVLDHSRSNSASSSSYDSSVEAAARRPGRPLLLPPSSMVPTSSKQDRPHARSPPSRSGIASPNSCDTNPGRAEAGNRSGNSPEMSAGERRQSSIETAMATWQAYTSAEAARSVAIANDYGASALLSAHFGSTAGAISSSGYTGTSCDTVASPITTMPLTPPATVNRGWRRCDENMEPAMRDCVASLRGFKMDEDKMDEEDEGTVDDKQQQQQQQQQQQARTSPVSKWKTSSLSRRPSTARSLDMLMASRSNSVSSGSPAPTAYHRATPSIAKQARPAMTATTFSSPYAHTLDSGGIGEQPQSKQQAQATNAPEQHVFHQEQVSGASAAATANAAGAGKSGALSRANLFLGRRLPLRRPATASSTVSSSLY